MNGKATSCEPVLVAVSCPSTSYSCCVCKQRTACSKQQITDSRSQAASSKREAEQGWPWYKAGANISFSWEFPTTAIVSMSIYFSSFVTRPFSTLSTRPSFHLVSASTDVFLVTDMSRPSCPGWVLSLKSWLGPLIECVTAVEGDEHLRRVFTWLCLRLLMSCSFWYCQPKHWRRYQSLTCL